MHRVALMLPMNKEKKVLLQHRTEDAVIKPGYWAFFGGHIEEGEDAEDAARREFQEELGIMVRSPKFLKHDVTHEPISGKEERVERFFYTTTLDREPADLRKQQKEGDDLGFFSREEFAGLYMSLNDREILYEIFDAL